MTKAYYDKISNTNGKCKANKFFFDIVFPNPTDVKDYMFVKSLVFANGRYPFYLKKKTVQEVDVYLPPHLYNNNKSFLKSIKEAGEAAIDSNALSYIRIQLRDPTYTISKIYGVFEQEKDSLFRCYI